MNVKVAKRMAGLGLVLILAGDLGFGNFLTVIGSVMFLVGIRELSWILKRHDLTIAFVMPLVLQVILAFLSLIVVGKSAPILTKIYENILTYDSSVVENWYSWFISSSILIIALTVATCAFFARAYKMLAERVNLKIFRTTAKLYKWSAILSVLLIGVFLMLVAELVALIAFFNMPEELT